MEYREPDDTSREGCLMDKPPAESSISVTSLAPVDKNKSARNPSMVRLDEVLGVN